MSDSDPPTPRVQLLLARLKALNNEIQKDMNRLVNRLEQSDNCLVLLPALHNIHPPKPPTHTIVLKEILTSKIDYVRLE